MCSRHQQCLSLSVYLHLPLLSQLQKLSSSLKVSPLYVSLLFFPYHVRDLKQKLETLTFVLKMQISPWLTLTLVIMQLKEVGQSSLPLLHFFTGIAHLSIKEVEQGLQDWAAGLNMMAQTLRDCGANTLGTIRSLFLKLTVFS